MDAENYWKLAAGHEATRSWWGNLKEWFLWTWLRRGWCVCCGDYTRWKQRNFSLGEDHPPLWVIQRCYRCGNGVTWGLLDSEKKFVSNASEIPWEEYVA